ncbi:auxin-responsive protein IAA7 [Brachypodium distachyon]|uniref:Auxin-responsive protein n=1 Tax=Brachypodium distachyon TaxID=15368 RepID=I1HYY9_BRADI|nr:auxin-responsive protein IAA7 [Brachypodium distachyon]KQJ94126.1 hypothetical protein BRADI_3g08667v3 [Brachypodium distachyon]|eukprot:XP_003571137.1 auxin-responsive protein IAA7 [Brachypodium distachyon]
MGEAESKKGRGACSTALLLNWMGEPSEQDQEEEETLQLSLGLPGGSRRTACRDKAKKHSAGDSSVLSLGYSTAIPSPQSQGKAQGSQDEPAATRNAVAPNNNGPRTRSPGAPVIGWPPVRASRRNLATSSSKASLEQQHMKKAVKAEETRRAPFVKINMDGIPIGRKIDLTALDSYEKLCVAVDKLFRHLLAAQNDPPAAGTECTQEVVAISGLLDGTGEYTLVYEDYEGDRVLVGDIPWGMFVSSVKRLRVLKTSDLSSSLITSSRKRTAAEC